MTEERIATLERRVMELERQVRLLLEQIVAQRGPDAPRKAATRTMWGD